MDRLPLLRPEQLDSRQRALYDSIVGGKRAGAGLTAADGSLVGPFNAWLHQPEVGRRISDLGEAVRFGSSLPKNVIEVAILVMARDWRAQFEGWAHERIARREGVAKEVIAAIREGRKPSFADADEGLGWEFATELLETRRVSDTTYRRVVDRFGFAGAVDLVTLLGYYSLVSMTLNTFAVPLPPGQQPPYPED